MVMDSWKRLYSNTPFAKFKEVCCAGLWKGAEIPNSPTNEKFEGFDKEGYSIWRVFSLPRAALPPRVAASSGRSPRAREPKPPNPGAGSWSTSSRRSRRCSTRR